MIPILALNELQLLVLIATYYFLASAQVLIAGIEFNRRDNAGLRIPGFFYNVLIAVHFVLMAALANAACHHWASQPLGLWAIALDLSWLLWIDAPIAALGLVLSVKAKNPRMIPEIVVFVLTTPPGMQLIDRLYGAGALLAAEAALFIFRNGLLLVGGAGRAGRHLSVTAPVDTMQTMPDGLAYIRPGQPLLFVNDAMRAALARLGISADYSTAEEVLKKIEDEGGTWLSDCGNGSRRLLDPGISKIVELSESEVLMFTTYRMMDDPSAAVLIEMDVTQAWRQQVQESALRAQMAKTEAALRELLDETEALARKKSVTKMRSVVHDVMGQRLSILHRLLEEDLTPERIGKMTETIATMMDDIERTGRADPAVELESIVEAFALVGVAVEITGSLPRDVATGRVLVGIIREGTTNAVRHAQAHRVDVQITEEGDLLVMSVSNDRAPSDFAAPVRREGTGIPGMRDALATVGGKLDIVCEPRFEIIARIPLEGPSKVEGGQQCVC